MLCLNDTNDLEMLVMNHIISHFDFRRTNGFVCLSFVDLIEEEQFLLMNLVGSIATIYEHVMKIAVQKFMTGTTLDTHFLI